MAEETRQPDETKLVQDLARGLNNTEAARQSGMSVRTVHRRLDEPGFRHQVAEARKAMIAEATGRLADAATSAVETLRELLRSGSDAVRLSAAKSILDGVLRFREAEEVADRLRQLEEAMRAVPTNGRNGANRVFR